MENSWQPNPQGINEIAGLLQHFQTPDSEVQRNIRTKLEEYYHSIPDYSCYLAYIFGVMTNESEDLRSCAGLLLKNSLKEHFSRLSAEQQAFIRKITLTCIADSKLSVRHTAGSIVVSLVKSHGLQSWPEVCQTLFSLLDNQDPLVVDGAFGAILKLCEDCDQQLALSAERPLNYLIPKFLSFFQSPFPNFRKYAISCINHFLVDPPAALLANMDAFLENVGKLASDPDKEIRVKVCNTFVTLIDVRREVLLPHINSVIEYILQATQDEDEHLSLAACEFWSAVASTSVCKTVLTPYLPKVIDVLLTAIKHSDDDLAIFQMEKEDDLLPDRESDIRPFFHKSKEEEEEEEEDDDDEQTEWNLRKCAASGLDILSTVLREDLLQPLLQAIQPRLAEGVEWYLLEPAILAIGAVSDGCYNGMAPHLPNLIPFLLNQSHSPEPLIRSISCWTLSRYSKWIAKMKDTWLRPVLEALFHCILDTSKRVQESACSAFATLEEEVREDLVPYLNVILQKLMEAYGRYHAKNLLILYDAIGTLADSVGEELNQPQYINILLPPLIKRWNETKDDDRSLCPLLECLTAIAIALGPGFQQFAPSVFERCIRLVENGCTAQAVADQGYGVEPDKDFIMFALDLISGMIEGCGAGMLPLLQQSTIVHLLIQCMKDVDFDVLQSSFALVGDITRQCFPCIRDSLGHCIPILIKHVNLQHIAVCNNACWALGEIAEKIGDAITPYVPELMNALISLIHVNEIHRSLVENIAITIGRVSSAVPDLVAPHIESFLPNWCLSLRILRDNEDKIAAFTGLVKVIRKNPDGILKHFVYLCDAIVSWQTNPPAELQESFAQILHGFKNSVDPNVWTSYYNSPQFPANVRAALQQRYNL